MDRVILHSDLNSFFASVETVLNPSLAEYPMAVCGDPDKRHGIILAKNEKAKKFGVVTAETIWAAKQKCPTLVLVRPHHDLYEKFSMEVNGIYREYTDLVEPFGIDESWLDVSGSEKLFGDGKTIAEELRTRIKRETGLTVSVGVSFNKTFAKLGSDLKKPDAVSVIDRAHFKEIVWRLPVSDLLYVGRSASKVLADMRIKTIGELAAASPDFLEYKLGKLGRMLYAYANGEDNDEVRSVYDERQVKSVGNGITFSRDLYGMDDIVQGLDAVCDLAAARMRAKHVKCTTVQLSIKDENFVTVQRQVPLAVPTQLARELREASVALLCNSWNPRLGIRSLTVTGTGLIPEDSAEQISFFDDVKVDEKEEKRERVMDDIRKKFGHGAIKSAGSIANNIGIDE
ncbi:MAG: DNA polymerase IV [Ruminococcaceae bacterium]|nr:DNA polymerase IV [Oscillospiraceae bacterium]